MKQEAAPTAGLGFTRKWDYVCLRAVITAHDVVAGTEDAQEQLGRPRSDRSADRATGERKLRATMSRLPLTKEVEVVAAHGKPALGETNGRTGASNPCASGLVVYLFASARLARGPDTNRGPRGEH